MNRVGVKLVITTDIGISNKDEIEYGNNLGIETIVLDHHPIVNEPNCIIVNPEHSKNINPTKYCGAGLSYITMRELYKQLNIDFDVDNDLISHAMIATIGDLVSLSKNNINIVKDGLMKIKQCKSKSLKWLLNLATQYSDINKLSAMDIAFGVVPLINSLNRVSSPVKALDLLTSNDANEVEVLGRYIVEKNTERKKKQLDNIILANKMLGQKKDLKDKIVFLDMNTNKTLAGLTASYITSELCGLPSIVVSKDNNGVYYGSGRSTKNCDFTELIREIQPYCVKAGGHKQAFGISFKEDQLENIRQVINTFSNKYKSGELESSIIIDAEITLDDITDELLESLYKLEPFGMDNPNPVFLTKGVVISNVDCVNFNTFMKVENIGEIFSFEEMKVFNAVAFKKDYNGIFNNGDVVDIIYELSYNKTLLIKKIRLNTEGENNEFI